MVKVVHVVFLVGTALSSLLLPCGGSATDEAPGQNPALKTGLKIGDDLFENVKVIQLRIQIPQAGIEALRNWPYAYVPAQIEEAGRFYPSVGVRLKGAYTFRPIDRKPSFSLKFNENIPQQRFHGLRRILLNNAIEEKTYVQEFLGQELFRAVGIPAPRVNYARVELNGRDLGLYVLVEGVTCDFLDRHFGGHKGNLYEGNEADIGGKLELDFGKDPPGKDLVSLITAVREQDSAKRHEMLGKVLDLDRFISYVALEMAINVWDGYSLRLNNYRVYCDRATGRATFIPHGLDDFFAMDSSPLLPEMEGSVANAVTDTIEDRQRYFQKMAELSSTILQREKLHRRVAELEAKIHPVLVELGEGTAHDQAVTAFHRNIDRRLDFIASELPAALGARELRGRTE